MKIIARRRLWFGISIFMVTISALALIFWGLTLGIDFKGGTIYEAEFNKKVEASQVKQALADLNLPNLLVQIKGESDVTIKTAPLSEEQIKNVKEKFLQKIGESREISLDNVGPTVSKSLTKKAIISVILACVGIVLYLAIAFRKVPKPVSSWRFGISAVIALFHDIIITLGAYSLFGHFFNFEVDSLFVVALLTILGFSVHDTIVVFDRIRENLRNNPGEDFENVTELSVNQTLVRSSNTSLTVMMVLAALLLIGGKTLQHFIAILLVGITSGTYSSIFNAAPVLVVWQNFIKRKARA
ncbi:MAG: protein translocase subunit SecF [Candidatus Nealsonbacteria bacterium CG23_combo_of_CG06-09_8_20_14_all_40_13]|uniref:Protein-export membrane protein SecF n=1 Tax=Candidatus Nealsonbacteria bacterium CG23_combo_of_CG06-09_8_20_14_all_40_13 TaxID=1974724 RepID=A0A2G9YSY8_9BACT|nr:MAG: protein translocase subunit SecF [Candidatus Nealsonbacteria bacterium CG23_combo_of_CG06-09_8_20_14_all_40_13]PIR70979.1 MAG: protein translocase subunit SecF [Candidatus Nealsonbacteria bacterium CG10_big_fil_rev_8_21_14_0_10_40_24]PIU43257.1 MAG: protein translocase subunit SecF [Candidatus Nealsonbacteria bacterium CG07_land_8_20_14_0_80_40_10]